MDFDISCKLGENLHEISKPIFWEKYFKMLSAEIFPDGNVSDQSLHCLSFSKQVSNNQCLAL